MKSFSFPSLAFLFCLAILFSFPAFASAATYYVKSDAVGDGSGSDWTNATTTVQSGIRLANDGDTVQVYAGSYQENIVFDTSENAQSITIVGGNGGTTVLTKSSGYVFNVAVGHATGTINFNNLSINATSTIIRFYGAASFVFNSCEVGDLTGAGAIFGSTATNGGSLTFNNSNVYNNSASYAFSLPQNINISFVGGSITTGPGNFIQTAASIGNVTFDSVSIDATRLVSGFQIFYTLSGSSFNTLTIHRNSVSFGPGGGFIVNRGYGPVLMTGNTMVSNSNTTAGSAISLGIDGTTSSVPNLASVTVTDNTVSFNGSAHSHGIMVGRGVTSGLVSRNKIINGDNEIVVKSDNVIVAYNLVINPSVLSGIFIRGGLNNKIFNNTFYSSLGYGVQMDTQDATSYENVDTALPSNASTIATATSTSIVGEGGSVPLLPSASQPPVPFRVRIALSNTSGGSLNLYQGVTSFLVTGVYNGQAVTETLTFTSTAGNKAVANNKARSKVGIYLYDSISQVVINNIPDPNFKIYIGTAGISPFGNQLKNNIFVKENSFDLIYDTIGSSNGNAKENIFDHNLYKTNGGNIASLNYGGTPPTSVLNLSDLRSGWSIYSSLYPNNDLNSLEGDPSFNNQASSDFSLFPTSPAIDAGTGVGLTTDYAGNSIYGTPDIGAYEYQPPFTFSANQIPTTGSARLYSDGKYRMTTASTTNILADFSVTPTSGYLATTTQLLDITLNTWDTEGDQNKSWTATSTSGDFQTLATSTTYTIGDLLPNVHYRFYLDSLASTTAVTNNAQCTNGICLSDATGKVSFTYVGGYSTHTFELIKDISSPLVEISSPAAGVVSGPVTLTAIASDDISLSSLQFYLDNSKLGASSATSPYALSWNTTETTDGPHTLVVVALDQSNNYSTSSPFTYTASNRSSVSSGGGSIAQTYIPVSTTTLSRKVATLPRDTATLTRNLSFKQSHPEVKLLQQFLNTHGFPVAKSGVGSKGHETTYFGQATKNAVMKFQQAKKIKPVSGYFGPLTRRAILKLI